MKKLVTICLVVIVMTWSSGITYGQNTQETEAISRSTSGSVIKDIDLSGPGSSKIIDNSDTRSSSDSTADAQARGGEAVAGIWTSTSTTSNYKSDGRVYPPHLFSPQGIFILPDGTVPVSGSVGDESFTYEITLEYKDIVMIRNFLNEKKIVRYKGIFEEFFDSFSPCRPNRDYYERKGFTIVDSVFRNGTRKNGKLTFIADAPFDQTINRKALLRECYIKSGYIPIGGLNVEGSEQDGFLSDLTGHTYTHNLRLSFYVTASLLWEKGATLAIFDGGIQQVGKGQTVGSASSVAYPTANIGTGAGLAGLTQESEIRGKPVFRTIVFDYDSDYNTIGPDGLIIESKKTRVDPEILRIKKAVLDYRLPVTKSVEPDRRGLFDKPRERRLKNARKIEGIKQR